MPTDVSRVCVYTRRRDQTVPVDKLARNTPEMSCKTTGPALGVLAGLRIFFAGPPTACVFDLEVGTQGRDPCASRCGRETCATALALPRRGPVL